MKILGFTGPAAEDAIRFAHAVKEISEPDPVLEPYEWSRAARAEQYCVL